MTINFKREFTQKIKAGTKTSTIRESNRYKPGQKLQLYCGMRTKACFKIKEVLCTRVRPVTLTPTSVQVDHEFVDKEQIARKDGFETYQDMWLWFSRMYSGSVFCGWLIEWKNQ